MSLRSVWNGWRRLVRWMAQAHGWCDAVLLAQLAVISKWPWLGRRGWPWGRPAWIRLQATRGAQVPIDPARYDQMVVFEEVFLDRVYSLDPCGEAPELIVDCGAHIGYFTALAAACFPETRIWAFEPHPANARLLREVVGRNRIGVEVRETAVGASDGRAWLVGSGCAGTVSAVNSGAEVAIAVVGLPDLIKKERVASLILKMDVEGAEREVLPALVPYLPLKTTLLLETHGGEHVWSECRDCLEGAGFHVEITRRRTALGIDDMYVDARAERR